MVADDMVTLLTDVVVGTALELGSVDEPAVVDSAEVGLCTADALTGAACGDSSADTTTSTATAAAATTGHRTRTRTGTLARRRNIPISLHTRRNTIAGGGARTDSAQQHRINH